MNLNDILIYVHDNGKSPFETWFRKIGDPNTRALIKKRLNRIRLGNFGDFKFISHGVFEIRLNFGPGYRIYFGRKGNKLIVLLCGGDKSSQYNDIQNAKKYWNNFLEQERLNEKNKKI